MKPDQSESQVNRTQGGGSIRQLQKEATRRAIIRAARACFLTSGVAKTSFDDIAARAGVSRATVYLYYSSKEHLLLGMLEEDWEAQRELFRLLRADARSPDDFASWLQQVIAGYRTRRGSMGLYALAVAQSPEMSDRIDGQRDRLIAALGESFPALVLDEHSSMEKRVDGQLMVIQIEHVCLMATRESQESAVEAGIDLVSRRMAAFVART